MHASQKRGGFSPFGKEDRQLNAFGSACPFSAIPQVCHLYDIRTLPTWKGVVYVSFPLIIEEQSLGVVCPPDQNLSLKLMKLCMALKISCEGGAKQHLKKPQECMYLEGHHAQEQS